MGFKQLLLKKRRELPTSEKRIGERVTLSECLLDDNISIGNDCYLHNVSLGSYSYLSIRVAAMNTKIGKFCSIAQGVCISLGMHPSKTFVSTSPVFFSQHKQCGTTFSDRTYFKEMGNTIIGNDVWIGVNAIIMDDIFIGDGAIIGAGAIVTKDVPPYAIVGGSPARLLRYRFDEEQIKFLLNFKWWDKDEKWIRENLKEMHNIEDLMLKYKIDINDHS